MNHENRLVVFMLLFLCVPILAKARARTRAFLGRLGVSVLSMIDAAVTAGELNAQRRVGFAPIATPNKLGALASFRF